MELRTFAKDPSTDRTLYLLTAENPSELAETLDIPERGFVCLVAWDAAGASTDLVIRVAESVLAAGATYVCTWGSDCERVHDIVDEAAFDPDADYDADPVIMTTWHSDEPLEEAIDFFLSSAQPVDEYLDDCTGAVAVTIGNATYAETIRDALRSPNEFRAKIPDEDPVGGCCGSESWFRIRKALTRLAFMSGLFKQSTPGQEDESDPNR